MVASHAWRLLGSCCYFLEAFGCLLLAPVGRRLHLWFPQQIGVLEGMRAMRCRCGTPTSEMEHNCV